MYTNKWIIPGNHALQISLNLIEEQKREEQKRKANQKEEQQEQQIGKKTYIKHPIIS